MENQVQENNDSSVKQRHGCVSAWLILMIIMNSIIAVIYLFAGNRVVENLPYDVDDKYMVAMGIVALANTAFAIMLFQWKKIGFYGFVVTTLISLALNISMGLGTGSSLFGLLGLVVLYAILQIDKDGVKAWDNLQ